MMFQSSFTEIGITGWMLTMLCVPFSGPKLRLRVVLERHADQIADRILRELGELLGGHLGARRGRAEQCRGERAATSMVRGCPPDSSRHGRRMVRCGDRMTTSFPDDAAAAGRMAAGAASGILNHDGRIRHLYFGSAPAFSDLAQPPLLREERLERAVEAQEA